MAAKLVGVKYVGNKPSEMDVVAFTGLVWTPAQTHNMSAADALPYSKHPDVWAIVDAVPKQPAAVLNKRAEVDVDEEFQIHLTETLPQLEQMDQQALQQYAARRFNHQFPPTYNQTQMRTKIVSLQNSGVAMR